MARHLNGELEPVLSVEDMMDRYNCSRQTAIRYMRQMEHQTKPYMVTVRAVKEWDQKRTVRPPDVIRDEMILERLRKKRGA